jgi:hypothetical protein
MSRPPRTKTSAPAPSMVLAVRSVSRAATLVPAVDITPDLGALRDIGADHLVWYAEQLVEQAGRLNLQPQHPRPLPRW